MRPQEPLLDVDEGMQMLEQLLVDAPAVARQCRRRRRLRAASRGGGAVVVMLPRRAPTGEEEHVDAAVHHGVGEKHDLATRTAEGSSGETSGNQTKDALGRLCVPNGSAASTTTLLLLELDQKMPTRLLHLSGPVEQIQSQGGHGITASLLQTKEESLPYYTAAGFFNVGDDRPLLGLDIAPVNTRVPVKWPLDTSVDDLMSHLPLRIRDKIHPLSHGSPLVLLNASSNTNWRPCPWDPKADKARGIREVDHRDANEGCVSTFLLLVVDDKASPPESVLVDEDISTMRSISNSVVDDASSPQDASSHDPNQRREALLYWIQLLNQFGGKNKPEWGSLPPLLDAAKVRDMDIIEMLLRGDADVNEVNAIGDIGLYWFLVCTYSTQEPRTLWILLKILLQNPVMRLIRRSSIKRDSSSLQKNQLLKKEGGGWLLDNELDDFTRCYAGPDASAGLVSSIFSAQVARMKSQCDLKQGFKFEIAPVNTRVAVKWPLGTSAHDFLSYLHIRDPKAHTIGGTGEVAYGDAKEGCLMLMLLVVEDNKTSPPSVVVEGVSTKRSICNSSVDEALSTQDASRHPTESREALLWIHLFNQFGVEHKLDWRSLPTHNTSKDRDMNTKEMLLRGDADVNQVNAIGHIALYWFLIGTSSIQDPRTVWLLLKNDAKNFQGNTNEPLRMTAFQNMSSDINSASIIPWDSNSIQKNQAMNKECGDWLMDEELNDFKSCYTGPDAWYSARKALVIGLKRGNQLQPRGIEFVHSEREKTVVNARDGKIVDVEDTFSRASLPAEQDVQTDAEDTGDTHDIEKRQVFPCSESNNVLGEQSNKCRLNNVYRHKNGDSAKNNNLVIPVFVRHISGELTVTVSLNQPLQYLMHLYAQKTKTKLEFQYFVYERKILEPDHTFQFYGVEGNTTVHVCTRLLGGMTTIEEYLIDNKVKFLTEVILPDGRTSLKMTKQGCLFLSTWLKCFTSAFANSKSWSGRFSLNDFKVTNGHVLVATNAIHMLTTDSMKADWARLVQHIRTIFYKNKPDLVSQFPPYLENLTDFLGSLRAPYLSKEDRLFIETHMCCVESTARGILLIDLRKKYKSLDASGKSAWDLAVVIEDQDKKGFATCNNLSKVAVFEDIINAVKDQSKAYTTSKNSTFTLMRDEFMHGPSKRFEKFSNRWREKFQNDDGIELMIPAYNKDLIPNIIKNWIRAKNVDIMSELLAAQVRCICHLCHPSHSGSKGGGESSEAGKGKQPSQAATSPWFSQPASPTQAAVNPWSALSAAVKSAPPTVLQSPSSSQFSSPSSKDIKGKGKQRK